ncbi:MAG: TIM barrel protein [Cyclobacteriaceae bacterium]
MKDNTEKHSSLSRRRFLGTALASGVAYTLFPVPSWGKADWLKRRYAKEVQIGAISYSFRQLPSSAEEVLGYLTQAGLNTTELMGYTAESFAGIPEGPARPPRGVELSAQEKAEYDKARKAADEESRKWRLSAPMDKFKQLRKMYNDEGITIDILKLGNPGWTDEEIDYAFKAAEAVGARGISLEISDETARRMGPFATKHKALVGMHNHTQVGDEGFSFDTPLSYSRYNMLNLDIGHYVAGTSQSPIPILKKYHDRISHLHIKDRKKGTNGGDNLPWGEGDTPIGEVLQLLQKEQYPISAMIELEYEIPAGSDVLTEVTKCADFCHSALA